MCWVEMNIEVLLTYDKASTAYYGYSRHCALFSRSLFVLSNCMSTEKNQVLRAKLAGKLLIPSNLRAYLADSYIVNAFGSATKPTKAELCAILLLPEISQIYLRVAQLCLHWGMYRLINTSKSSSR